MLNDSRLSCVVKSRPHQHIDLLIFVRYVGTPISIILFSDYLLVSILYLF